MESKTRSIRYIEKNDTAFVTTSRTEYHHLISQANGEQVSKVSVGIDVLPVYPPHLLACCALYVIQSTTLADASQEGNEVGRRCNNVLRYRSMIYNNVVLNDTQASETRVPNEG